KFAYPKTDPWLNRVNGPTAAFIVSQPTDKFVYNYRSYDMPTYYDKAKQQWYTLSGSKKTYISEGTDLLKVYTSGERKMFLFLGKGAQYCGSRHLLFEQGQNMVMIWLPEACSEDAKKDPDPVWNKKTYFVPQLDAELEKIVPTIKSLI
ncbi:MAG: hypothetical protein JWL85_781, partial [Candidatus Saccharibacteria bacterium]|nr:hypothetical protein [Candidatus Saccharibacteria bacterium]